MTRTISSVVGGAVVSSKSQLCCRRPCDGQLFCNWQGGGKSYPGRIVPFAVPNGTEISERRPQ